MYIFSTVYILCLEHGFLFQGVYWITSHNQV
uniref:Uncharacterized protein n=1 Tax=Arundo donax TaxID=35708 RepID=A0A0A9BJK5_ARUDO